MAIGEMQGPTPTPEDELCEIVKAIVNRVPWEEFTTEKVNEDAASRHVGAQIHEIPARLLEILTGEAFAYNPDGGERLSDLIGHLSELDFDELKDMDPER